jgi:uncharacterized protein YndB with AHSA1/START domain
VTVPVISTEKDLDALTLTFVAELAAPADRVWQLWSDPRQLERWWGPPTWPATFEQHDFVPGGSAQYFMTGPEGDKARGWWRFLTVDEPRALSFDDGFSDESGAPNLTMPVVRAEVQLQEVSAGTRMRITSTFDSAEQLEQLASMGMIEGMSSALGQLDALLADG